MVLNFDLQKQFHNDENTAVWDNTENCERQIPGTFRGLEVDRSILSVKEGTVSLSLFQCSRADSAVKLSV